MHNEGAAMYRDASRSIAFTPAPKRSLQPLERTRPWGMYELLSSMLFVCLSLLFVGAISALVIQLIGIDSPIQLYGFTP